MISKKDIDKLSQVKREEYLAKVAEVKSNIPFMKITIKLIWMFIGIIGFFLVIIPLWKMAYGAEVASALWDVLISIGTLMKISFTLSILIDLAIILINVSKLVEIRKKYFNIIVEAKKR